MICSSAKIGKNVTINEGTIIGENVIIEDNVYLDYDCIIRDNVHIKENSFIGARSILGEYLMDFYMDKSNKVYPLIIGKNALIKSQNVIYGNTQIGDNFQSGHNTIIENNCNLGNNVLLQNNVIIHAETNIEDNVKILDETILGRIPVATGSIERKIDDNLSPLKIGSGSVIGVSAVVYKGTTIGNNVLIADSASIREECLIDDDCIISRGVTINYNTKIGKRTKVMDLTHITGNMVIEDDVFVSVGITSTNDNTMGRTQYGEDHVKGPIIRKFATIGGGACLLPGVEVGDNTIIGMGSVVAKSIPSKKVAMGIPAKVVKDVAEDLLKK
ncbi:acyltransferase [Clostridium sp.]|uniref:acyltransferase n=1 Tax=Clostridium sp. TaxID=1506 RepID=UPI00262CEA45|nr:N-acetyltransferase [Clostridium sp.]